MKTSIKNLREFIHEELSFQNEPYVIRGGSKVLVKRAGDEWSWTVLRQVTYFNNDDLVKGPWSKTQEQVWKFRRGGDLYAIRDDQFLSKPEWKYKSRR